MDAHTAIAGPPTIFRSGPIGPAHVGSGVQPAMTSTRLGPVSQSDITPQFGAASTRLAPAAPALAYSMTGNMEALTDYVQEYRTVSNDHHVAQQPHDIIAVAPDRDPDDSGEDAPAQPTKKSFLLAGSLAAAFVAIAFTMLGTSVVLNVSPTAEQKPITTSQVPAPAPLVTQVSKPPVAIPAAAPVEPLPAPPAVAPAPPAPVVPRQAPPRATQTPPRVTQTSSHETETPPVTDQSSAPGEDSTYHSGTTHDGPRADNGDGLPPGDGEGVPPRDGPLPDTGDGPPPRSHSPFSPNPADPLGLGGGEPGRGGGLLGGCIPLLPC